MKSYQEMTKEELLEEKRQLETEYRKYQMGNVSYLAYPAQMPRRCSW